ncbi:hypothetical protein RAN94_15175, partial [Enterobacter hormaechei subsp. xiangfangensis]|nr:hypothetical protein [Enterobacter hormaechei subsp. xiangfangensis]MDS0101415.1 hypothetical protein [Enterobacter hormaechei subsp. xiangfangensis]
ADRNRSHWSTSKTPSYTKSVSWQHHLKIAINEGKQLWTFKSSRMNKTFTARILVKDWIKNYQSGLIPPIGPKDTLLAEFTYDLYKPYDKRKTAEVRNVKIIKIEDIVRGGSDEQFEIPA